MMNLLRVVFLVVMATLAKNKWAVKTFGLVRSNTRMLAPLMGSP
jgi:hypothetical protein